MYEDERGAGEYVILEAVRLIHHSAKPWFSITSESCTVSFSSLFSRNSYLVKNLAASIVLIYSTNKNYNLALTTHEEL